MQLPQIRLHQTYAQIGLRTIQPVQEIQQIPAELTIKQNAPRMEIERNPSKLDIDLEQAWNELNLKNLATFSSDMVEYSKQEALEAVAEIAQEGDQLASIEHKTDGIVAIATNNANPEPIDFNIAFIPSPGSVKIHYTPTELHIEWKQGGVEIDSTQHKPTHNYTPGRTEVYLRQAQQLQIDFIGTKVNNKL